jgi:hypothetical protein
MILSAPRTPVAVVAPIMGVCAEEEPSMTPCAVPRQELKDTKFEILQLKFLAMTISKVLFYLPLCSQFSI